jgi:glucose-1-phosphate thymidylyltransferase
MKAVILTAGQGIRLLPLTQSRTKGMIPVGNRPILEHIVNALRTSGINEVVMVVGFSAEKVMNYFGNGKDFNINIEYIHQKKLLGTAQALSLARDVIDSDFLILPGDNIIDAQGLKSLIKCKKEGAALLVSSSNRPSKYGVVGLKGNYVHKIVEKPKISGDLMSTGVPSIFSLALWEYKEETISNIISTGTYRFDPMIFDIIDEAADQGRYTLTDVVQILIERNIKVKAFNTDLWIDAVYPWDMLDMNSIIISLMAAGKGGKIEKNNHIEGPVSIGEDSIIHSGCYIQGPVVIGKGCRIGPNVVIYPSTCIGDNVTIEPFTQIKNSIVMDDVVVRSQGNISNTVISDGVQIGSGLVTDTTPSKIRLHEYSHSKELGAIIGEDSNIGHSVIVNSGVIIGCQTEIAPQKTIDKNIPNGSNVL